MKRITLPNEIVIAEAQKLIEEGQDVLLRVKGNSMLPFIRGGEDFAVLRKVSQSLKRWDIVLAQDLNGRLIIHRIIDITPECVTLMGDGNLGYVEYCAPDGIIARLENIKRGERLIECNTSWARRKAIVWYHLRPARRYLLAIYRRIKPL